MVVRPGSQLPPRCVHKSDRTTTPAAAWAASAAWASTAPGPAAPLQIPDFIFTAGPGQQIGVFYADGRRMTRIPPGTYTIQVHDLSTTHDFHLSGPGGIDRRTEVSEIEHPIWTVTFRAGTYTFKCDVHASMKGTFVVATGAPAPPRCKVPRVVGKRLAPRAGRFVRGTAEWVESVTGAPRDRAVGSSRRARELGGRWSTARG
jgi:plastocyanin